MSEFNRTARLASIALVSSALILILFDLLTDINLTLPIIFLSIGAGLTVGAIAYSTHWVWLAYLYLPGCTFLALGLIFLLNVLTDDWTSWAYAWLLGVAGLGAGGLLAARTLHWPTGLKIGAVGLVIAGIVGFGIFGAIAGGLFVRVMVPILLVLLALSLYVIPPETYLPVRFRKPTLQSKAEESPVRHTTEPLIDPLSSREIEVLQLIDQGLTNAEIAARLTLAGSTVKTHINNIYGKLGVQTRTQALKRARELSLL
jgi:DNA-binding CsgD family transcriptional regulator